MIHDVATADGAAPQVVLGPCPRCGGHDVRALFSGRDWLYGVAGEFYAAECVACGLWHQNPRPARDEHHLLYPREYGPHSALEHALSQKLGPGVARYLRENRGYSHLADEPGGWKASRAFDAYRRWLIGTRLVPTFVQAGAVLDLGCGNGSGLAELRRLGWTDLQGIELMPEAAARARERDFPVITGPIEATLELFPDAHFDVIRSAMVLEHLGDPFDVIRCVAAKLKPGGQFLFSTIDSDSIERRLYGAHWAGFDFPRHMVYFNRRVLADALVEHFEQPEWFHQSAPIDYVRSSSWRRRPIDRIVVAIGIRALAIPSLLVAALHRSTRLSVRSRRRKESRP